jgi:hypothetical protein
MLVIVRNFIVMSGISALAAWGYDVTGNVLLLLTTAWFAGFALFSTFSPSKYGGSLRAMLYRKGFIPPGEAIVLLLTMGVFSFVANFAIQSHWFLVAHGVLWTLVGAGNFLLITKR